MGSQSLKGEGGIYNQKFFCRSIIEANATLAYSKTAVPRAWDAWQPALIALAGIKSQETKLTRLNLACRVSMNLNPGQDHADPTSSVLRAHQHGEQA